MTWLPDVQGRARPPASIAAHFLAEPRSFAAEDPQWSDGFVLEVRHSGARWRVAENGAPLATFAELEDAVPLAMAYAQARGDAGHDATVVLKLAQAPRLRVARYGPGAMALQA